MELAPRRGVEAARWFRSHNGDAAYHNMCKAFVRTGFLVYPSMSNTAIECYEEARFKHPIRSIEDLDDVPRYAPVYFDTSNAAEHVLFSIRRDRQGHRLGITTDARDGRIGIVRLIDLARTWGPPIAWVEDMDGQRVWTPPDR